VYVGDRVAADQLISLLPAYLMTII